MSTVFEPGGVVGAGAHDEVGPDWRLLPSPKVDVLDPGVGVVLGLADGEPAAVVATLTSALVSGSVPATPETLLRLARAHLDAGMPRMRPRRSTASATTATGGCGGTGA